MEHESDFVNFGQVVASGLLGMSAQYASHYFYGLKGCPKLGEDLRFKRGDPDDYHTLMIHHGDAFEFARRVKKHRENEGALLTKRMRRMK